MGRHASTDCSSSAQPWDWRIICTHNRGPMASRVLSDKASSMGTGPAGLVDECNRGARPVKPWPLCGHGAAARGLTGTARPGGPSLKPGWSCVGGNTRPSSVAVQRNRPEHGAESRCSRVKYRLTVERLANFRYRKGVDPVRQPPPGHPKGEEDTSWMVSGDGGSPSCRRCFTSLRNTVRSRPGPFCRRPLLTISTGSIAAKWSWPGNESGKRLVHIRALGSTIESRYPCIWQGYFCQDRLWSFP